jgi:hypothetical protein
VRAEAIYAARQLRNGVLRSQPRYYIGVDLGQAQDYTAIVVIERAELRFAERDPVTMSFLEETRYAVRHAERIALGSPYPEVVEQVRRMVKREPLAGQVKVIVDATGVGAPVVDLLKKAELGCPVIPVIITGGDTESTDGARYRVPKKDLLAGLQVAFQRRRLRLSARLGALEQLMEELRGMRVRMTADGGSGLAAGGMTIWRSRWLWRCRASREAGW